jgi:tetratricopeptide (TPR) repeat protein
VLRDASGLERDALVRGLRELADRHLLAPEANGRVWLRHPLVAEAVRRRLLGPEATDVHRRLAQALATAGHPAAEVAEHWQRAGDPANELDWRISAALDAGARFAPRTEWRHWRRAFELWPDETRSRGAGSRLTFPEALLRGYDAAYANGDLAGQTDVVEQLLVIADANATPRGFRAEALRRAGDHVAAMGEARRGLQLLREAADIYRDLPPCTEYVETLENQAMVLTGLGGPRAALPAARKAVEIAERIGNRQRWRHAVAELAWYEGALGHHEQARAHVAQSLDGPDPDGDPFPEVEIGGTLTDLLLVQHAPPEAFERAGRPGLETAERWNLDSFWTNLLRSNLALGYLVAGLVDRAVAVLGTLPDEVTADEAPRQFSQVCVETVQGRLEVAARRLEALVRLPGDMPPKLEGAVAGARIELWRNQPASACTRFETMLADVMTSETSSLAGVHLLVLARVAADVASIEDYGPNARTDSAASLRNLRKQAPVDPLGDHLTSEARTALLRTWEAELARLEGRESSEAWAAAATAWEPMVRPHDAAYCRWRAAEVALASGQGSVAGRLLKRAARDAREHVPLTEAIARTAAYAPQS